MIGSTCIDTEIMFWQLKLTEFDAQNMGMIQTLSPMALWDHRF